MLRDGLWTILYYNHNKDKGGSVFVGWGGGWYSVDDVTLVNLTPGDKGIEYNYYYDGNNNNKE